MNTDFKDEVYKLYKQLMICINLEPEEDDMTFEECDMFTDMHNLKNSIQNTGYNKSKK